MPEVGDEMFECGGVLSAEALAGFKPAINVVACTPMSASKFTVACCILMSVGVPGIA